MTIIKTVAQAQALPEIRSTIHTDDGQSRLLSSEPLHGDSIALFQDADGRTMSVVHTAEQGWCKAELRL